MDLRVGLEVATVAGTEVTDDDLIRADFGDGTAAGTPVELERPC